MYQELFKAFENVSNLGGKAWEHAVALDLLNSSNIQDCSIHCFHYQQMFECFFQHILETKSQFGAYSKSHKLNKLLEEVIGATAFKTNKSKYRSDCVLLLFVLKNTDIILILIVKDILIVLLSAMN